MTDKLLSVPFVGWSAAIIAAVWGLCMPTFYDWTGADQSRPAPIVNYIALAMIAGNCVLAAVLFWHHRRTTTLNPNPKQLKIWQLMGFTLLIALALAVAKQSPIRATSYLFVAIAWGFAIWLMIRCADKRLPVVLFAACQWLPFLWIFRGGPFFSFTNLGLLAGLPGILPSMWIGQWLRFDRDSSMALGAAVAGIEMIMGLAMIQRGNKRAIAAIVAVFTLSIFSSFALHAAVRA